MNKLLATYKILIENAGMHYNKRGDMEIDALLEDVNNEDHLTEEQKDELWEFGDSFKVQD